MLLKVNHIECNEERRVVFGHRQRVLLGVRGSVKVLGENHFLVFILKPSKDGWSHPLPCTRIAPA